jgi:hypothetical protein
MLDQLRFAHYHFVLEMQEALAFPPFWGSALRGGFGHALKHIACRQPGQDCDACAEYSRCAYGYVFETRPPADSEVLRTHSAVPRPFVFKVPYGDPREWAPGSELHFELLLIGQGISYLPYFIQGFKRLGEEGLGGARAHFQLKQVWTCDPLGPWKTLIYDGDEDALRNRDESIGMREIDETASQLKPDAVAVRLLIPTRIRVAGAIARTLPFQLLIRNIVRRVSSLAYFHCGERWETDYRGLIADAGGVRITQEDLHSVQWSRWSSRQRQRIPQGGMLGTVRYAGPLADYRSLLVIGSLIHVGKGTVSGSGRFVVA